MHLMRLARIDLDKPGTYVVTYTVEARPGAGVGFKVVGCRSRGLGPCTRCKECLGAGHGA
jgi:hypothetical protein